MVAIEQETQEQEEQPGTLKRRLRQYTPWRVAFWDRLSGVCDWIPQDRRNNTVPTVLNELVQFSSPKAPPPRILFITGASMTLPPDHEWIDTMIAAGWEILPGYVNESSEDGARRMSITYKRGDTVITLKTAADWFGPDASMAHCRQAWQRLTRDIASRFDAHATLISTPGRTGLDLLERSLPFGRVYPPIDAELASLIYDHCGQGRIETVGQPRELKNMLGIDGRWMYSACLSHLPSGPLTHDTLAYAPARHDTGFLLASVRIPDNWAHIGLLPLPLPYRSESVTRRLWPSQPGQWVYGFWSAAEIVNAFDHGWHVSVKERWMFTHPEGDPAAVWRNKLVRLRQDYERAAYRGDVVAKILQATVRTIMLHAIGRMFARESYDYGYCPTSDLAALLAKYPTMGDGDYDIRGDRVHYRVAQPLRLDEWRRPEWAATIWARARRRLALAALQIPYDRIVALRTDCIWTDGYDPHWQETGANGEFRLKEWIPGPMQAPQNDTDMRRLLTGAQRI